MSRPAEEPAGDPRRAAGFQPKAFRLGEGNSTVERGRTGMRAPVWKIVNGYLILNRSGIKRGGKPRMKTNWSNPEYL